MDYLNNAIDNNFCQERVYFKDYLLPVASRKNRERHTGSKKFKRYYLDQEEGIYLTEREHETLINLLQGYALKEIAKEKHISPRTVEQYAKSIRVKLGFNRKQEMVRTLMLNNFLPVLMSIKPIYTN